MRTYRLYYMHALTGWIDHFDEMELADDETAEAYAAGQICRERLELWADRRRIAVFDPLSGCPRPAAARSRPKLRVAF